MSTLATSHASIMHTETAKRFVSRQEEWNELFASLPSDAIVLWADTENFLTTAYFNTGSTHGDWAEMDTAFTILKKTPGDRGTDTFHAVADECEQIAFEILRRIEHDADPYARATCESVPAHITLSSVRINRDGPYTNEFYGVTASLKIKVRGAVPAYNTNKWT